MPLDRFEGFLQVYQLQTEADEEETWRDLVRLDPSLSRRAVFPPRIKSLTDSVLWRQSIHGFDRTLTLVATRREDYEMDDIMVVEDAQSYEFLDPSLAH